METVKASRLAAVFMLSSFLAACSPNISANTQASAVKAPSSAGIPILADDILPQPPSENSPQFLADQARYREGLALRAGERGRQADQDADLSRINELFSPAVGIEISTSHTPDIMSLIAYAAKNSFGKAGSMLKKKYSRIRPYIYYDAQTCHPADEKKLSTSGSYPSGHSTIGWGVALALAEIAPDRANEILRKGYALGQSRVICGYHWQSDVEAGRLVAAANIALLHSDAEFLRRISLAKQEYARLKSK